MDDERWFTVAEIAARLRVHEQTVRRWIKDGRLKAKGLGGRTGYRVRQVDLNDFLEREEGRTSMKGVLPDFENLPPAGRREIEVLVREGLAARQLGPTATDEEIAAAAFAISEGIARRLSPASLEWLVAHGVRAAVMQEVLGREDLTIEERDGQLIARQRGEGH